MASAYNELGYFVRTKNPSHNFRLVWTVENFLQFPAKVGSFLKSPHFLSISGDNHGVMFYVKLHPFGIKEETKDSISVYLCLEELPNGISDIRADFAISLLNENKEKINTFTSSKPLEKGGLGWSEYIKREELQLKENEYLPDGHLTIECNVEAYFNFKDLVQSTMIKSESGGLTPAGLGVEIVKTIYEEKICSDIKLQASDGRLLDAHKSVLSVRSPYFKAMFEHPMKENEEGMVDLSEDLNGQELESLLEYIYLGTPPANLKETARKMFQIGDMQGISGLCSLSEEALICQLDDNNAVELLNFANKYGAKKLKKAAARQIANS